MGKVAESRKNMRIDFRPKVVARTMTWELILASISLAAVVSLPLYFIKVKPIFQKYQEEYRRIEQEKILTEDNTKVIK